MPAEDHTPSQLCAGQDLDGQVLARQIPRGRGLIVVGAVSMAVGVALGAFGAHALRDVLGAKQLEWWHTAQEYMVWHALGLVLIGMLESSRRRMTVIGWLFVVGTLVFSGSLFAMSLGGPTWLGAVTPIGGASFIVGWVLLAVSFRGLVPSAPESRL